MTYQQNISKELQRTFINRSEAMREIRNAKFDLVIPPRLADAVRTGTPLAGKGARDPYLTVTMPNGRHLEVDYMTVEFTDNKGVHHPPRPKTFKMKTVSAFTSTTKMSCASFSTPAGPTGRNGTCVASTLSRSYTDHHDLGTVDTKPIRPQLYICRFCYANKSNYMHRQSQYQQAARRVWLTSMLRRSWDERLGRNPRPEETSELSDVSRTMSDMLFAHSLNVPKRERMGEDPRFFRIHDSGDLFDDDQNVTGVTGLKAYLMWCDIAEDLEDIQFWCPTRMWTLPYFTEFVQNNPPPDNLSLRPSALHFDDTAPEVEGFAEGSTANLWEEKKRTDPVVAGIADWSCPAYAKGGHSCRGALLRARKEVSSVHRTKAEEVARDMDEGHLDLTDGGKDCRVCWLRPDLRVSYKAH